MMFTKAIGRPSKAEGVVDKVRDENVATCIEIRIIVINWGKVCFLFKIKKDNTAVIGNLLWERIFQKVGSIIFNVYISIISFRAYIAAMGTIARIDQGSQQFLTPFCPSLA
eukprot:GHVP01053207.1.p2 GENE.GHVP01053207.1~~GHVP01053207.1.p2  ORF type:complete len:111 (+),score=16.62 GHVP01053207.1:875-1207(+)